MKVECEEEYCKGKMKKIGASSDVVKVDSERGIVKVR